MNPQTAPATREAVHDIFWRFAAERQSIFERRWRGESAPWTEDTILARFKFCNVYRASDRVSQFLIREVCYQREQPAADDLAFQIVAMRTFSRIESWNSLSERLGHAPLLRDLASGALEDALTDMRDAGERLYTGAFILCATDAYGRKIKHLNHVELFKHMFLDDDLASRISEASSLEEVYLALHAFPLMGDFMSYQIAIDLNYSPLIDFSENDFTVPGPGAVRGLRKLFTDFGDYSPSGLINWLVERQHEEFAARNLRFEGLWGRSLHAIDVQNLLCETDKYCREALPELASSRTRIKSKFEPTPTPIDYFFPPKWGLETATARALVSA
ncbi:nucleotide kinase domain-containing protein [Microbacterium sulfonylureivorans]|uniref:nucleotide kinase domain-containing protein n=1 Tax=Microbacterium sulfonylureivorans TaxID=2486854 RepID=UPI00197B892D|nr:nucleotide kinase domain-containing protein [Microbacterium sulfonylureivorans]